MSNRWSLIFIHFLIIDVVFVTNYKSLCTLGCPLFVVIQKSTSQKDCVVGPLVILKTVVHNLLCSKRFFGHCPKPKNFFKNVDSQKWSTVLAILFLSLPALPSEFLLVIYWSSGSDTYIITEVVVDREFSDPSLFLPISCFYSEASFFFIGAANW